MGRIFLCHAKEDEQFVRQCYAQLHLVGHEPWLDKESILPGQDWKVVIETEINITDFIVVFVVVIRFKKMALFNVKLIMHLNAPS